jgi:hypothetical protein
MKLSKELNDALEAVSKEVDSWPAWTRSIDMHDQKKEIETQSNASANEKVVGNRKTTHLARAAGA